MSDPLAQLREAAAAVAQQASHIRVDYAAIPAYAESLPLAGHEPGPDPELHLIEGTREELAAFWLTLDAINFGSGWFPTLRKRAGRSGYATVAAGTRDRFTTKGAWSPEQLTRIEPAEIAAVLGQDPRHELMQLFALSLRDLGRRVDVEYRGSFAAVLAVVEDSATVLVSRLAGWDCFSDTSWYDGLAVPFLKRAQIAAADLHRANVAHFADLGRLTMFADNMVPHVLRLDGVLHFDADLVARIERGELIEHGSEEEVEIRACAVQAVELIVAARPGTRAADVDQLLWLRGQNPRYKATPRHRSRCTAY
jgi:putative queuosine salvage protein